MAALVAFAKADGELDSILALRRRLEDNTSAVIDDDDLVIPIEGSRDDAQDLLDEDLQTCEEDTDCDDHPYYICVDEICKHKSVFPMYTKEFIGFLILPVLLAFANVGGIGGGGLIIPITMTLFTFTTKEAIAISGFTILTGSFARFLF